MHREEQVSFQNMVVFNTYEFYPVQDFSFSNLQMLKEVFLSKVDIDPKNIFSPDATIEKDRIADNCEEYEKNLTDMGDLITCYLGWAAKGTWASTCQGADCTRKPDW